MSHESFEPGRAVIYNLPTLFSDSLRSLEFSQFFRDLRGPRFAVRTADGWSWPSPAPSAPEFVAQFRSRAELDAVIGGGSEAALARTFLNGGFEVQGNTFAVLSVAEYALLHSEGLSSSLVRTLGRVTAEFSRRLLRVRGNATPRNWLRTPCPLDLPIEFFQPWLGPLLCHSCACFGSCREDFETAQRHALERVCAGLDLCSTDRLLDVGCGWGGLLIHAAQLHDADAQGIVSHPAQAAIARQRILQSGLHRGCHVADRDLRTAPYPEASFDKIASLGIFEQVASGDLGKYLACLQRMLIPGGLLVFDRLTPSRDSGIHLHSLPAGLSPGPSSELLSKDIAVAESNGWELLNVESIARDYEESLRVWIDSLRRSWICQPPPPFDHGYRAWLLYLVEIATGLHTGELQVHRMLLRRPCGRAAVC